jgi:hypothetical protein
MYNQTLDLQYRAQIMAAEMSLCIRKGLSKETLIKEYQGRGLE